MCEGNVYNVWNFFGTEISAMYKMDMSNMSYMLNMKPCGCPWNVNINKQGMDVCVCVSLFTHADRPSTSSLVGMMPFLLRTAATFSTSLRSTAFISRSSYLFQSVFWW